MRGCVRSSATCSRDIEEELFLTQGAERGTNVLDDFGAFVESEIVKWKKVVDFAGAKVD